MVEIKKIDVSQIPYDTKNIEGIEVKVYQWIPYEKKLEFVREYVEYHCVIDFANGYAYRGASNYSVKYYLLAKYYTDIDVTPYENCMSDLFDTIYHQDYEMFKVAYEDIALLMQMCEDSVRAIIEQYNLENSLQQKIKSAFAGILNGGDLLENAAKDKNVNEQMIELLAGSNKNKEDNAVLFPWAAKKKD